MSQNQRRRKLIEQQNNTAGNVSSNMPSTFRNSKYKNMNPNPHKLNLQIDQDEFPLYNK